MAFDMAPAGAGGQRAGGFEAKRWRGRQADRKSARIGLG
jgi:hypothetical protein